MSEYNNLIETIDWEKLDGLVPVIVQNEKKEVLTFAYMNKESLEKTLKTKNMFYYSKSKNRIRMKGEVSGNIQIFEEVYIDCDNDALLFIVNQKGSACHLGTKSCFRKTDEKIISNNEKIDYSLEILKELEALINERKNNPQEKSYTNDLFKKGKERILKKFGEEAVEVITATKREDLIYETADMMYHLLVLLSFENIPLSEIMKELKRRRK